MKIAIDMGHCLSGWDTSADGRKLGGFLESQYDRVLGAYVIKYLHASGHEVVNVTVDNGNVYTNMYGSLGDRVRKANAANVDVYWALHFNASNGEGSGTETFLAPRSYFSSDATYNKNLQYAQNVNNALAKLGFSNRGVKTEEYYVLVRSNALAILTEVCFCDSKKDVAIYNSLGHEKIAKAMVEGFLGKTVTVAAPVAKPSKPVVSNTNNTGLKHRVGEVVDVSSYYASSTDPVSKAVIKNKRGTITKVLTNGAHNPYLLDNGSIGWCNDGDIRRVVSGETTNGVNSIRPYERKAENGVFTFSTAVQVRTAPREDATTGLCYYAGEECTYHHVILNCNGFHWIEYTRSNGQTGYLKVQEIATGERYGSAR